MNLCKTWLFNLPSGLDVDTLTDRLTEEGEKCIVTCMPIVRQLLSKHITAHACAPNRTSIARQRTSQHASLTIDAMFSA
jgi:hypothetical protein